MSPLQEPASDARATTEAVPRMTGRQTLVLTLLLGSQFMVAVDFSILNVALPAVGAGLGFPLGQLQWIATSFALAAAGFTLFFGRVADLFGRKRLFVGGMAVLGLSSLLGGLATTPETLIVARVLQGLATAAVTPAGLALLTTAFREGPLRERALGLNGALMSAGFTAGAVLGGLLTELLSWRWAFLVNVPVAAAVVALAPSVIRDSKIVCRHRLDVPGAVTVTGGLLALVYGLTRAGAEGWADPIGVVGIGVGLALLVGFWFVEQRAAAPLVPVRIMRRRSVVWGNVAGLVAFATETSLVFLLTLYLQEVLGYSPLATGLAFGVLGLGTVLGGPLGGRVVGRYGTVRTPLVGFTATATSGLPDHEQGLATGLATMTQQVGITLGIPVMSAVVAARGSVLSGVTGAVVVNSGLVLAGSVLASLLLARGRRG
ncbi:MFS transporter [Streptomyces sp. NPDC059009]|uniref:MFS transporter n=1 Tax=Streptomyces sp. NPDC059009 TaxID=3346694 RepID=UPI0036A1339F